MSTLMYHTYHSVNALSDETQHTEIAITSMVQSWALPVHHRSINVSVSVSVVPAFNVFQLPLQ